LVFVKVFLTAFFSFSLRPFFLVFRFLFFKVVVKAYLQYLFLIKRLGWDKWRGGFLVFIFNQRTVHVLVVILVIVVSASGLWSRYGQAKTLSEKAGKTPLSRLISGEFSDMAMAEEELVVETMTDGAINPHSQLKYQDGGESISGGLGISTSTIDYEGDGSNLVLNQEDSLVKPELVITKRSKKTRKEIIEYLVLPGDSISTIAADFDVSVNTILWENSLTAYSLIRPGDKLFILPSTGVVHKVGKGETLGAISSKYDIEVEEILKANSLLANAQIAVGQKLFVPGGKKYYVAPPVSAKPANIAYNPIAVIKDLISPDEKTAPANKMFWPAKGVITQYFTWKHHGLDIANKQGTPIYAADAGTVIYSAWSTAGYGNMIEIDHGGDKHTRYGHFYQLFVKKGDVVKRGQVIGAMGTTGKSTGPHLHLEVRINNKTYNPLSYIK
jgi:LysM repeat protein